MKRIFVLSLLAIISSIQVVAQKHEVTGGEVIFFSEAPLENIEARNKLTKGLINLSSSDMAFIVPIKGFQFEKTLMQEHFNEKYMHSDKFPHGKLVGKIEGFNSGNESKQDVVASGKLTIHGVEREVKIKGTMWKEGNKLHIESKFHVQLKDHDIEVPSLMWQNIAETIEVTVNLELTRK